MSSKMEPRIFVGGLSWDTTERQLEDAFRRFGKVVETQMIMVERDTGRPRGFGFVTFQDQRAVEDAIHDMHGQDFDGRNITVNKAQPKMISDDTGYGYGGGGGSRYSSGGSYRGSDGPPPAAGRSDCFKCGRPGHWARDCPNSGSGGGGGGRFSSRPRFGGGGGRGGDRYGSDRYGDRYADDRYEGGRYGDRDRVDSGKDHRYSSGRDRYGSDRYPAGEERFSGERYGSDRYPANGGGGGVGKDRGYERGDAGPRSGGGDRYGSGGLPARSSGGPSRGGDTYRERPGPYDRPSRGARQSSYEDRYP